MGLMGCSIRAIRGYYVGFKASATLRRILMEPEGRPYFNEDTDSTRHRGTADMSWAGPGDAS